MPPCRNNILPVIAIIFLFSSPKARQSTGLCPLLIFTVVCRSRSVINGDDIIKAYAYLLQCSDKTLYAGWTNDPERRLLAHNSGKGSKYTRSRLPVKMVYIEEFESQSEAMKREAALKKLTRAQKLRLISAKSSLLHDENL